MTKPSQIQIPAAHLVALHIVLPPPMSSIPRGNVLSVHLKSDLSIVGIRVAYVTSLAAAFPDLKQTALQVVLQLAYALMKALCSASSCDVTSRRDATCLQLYTPRLRCTAEYKRPSFWKVFSCIRTFSAAMRSAVTLHVSKALHSIAGRSGLQSLNYLLLVAVSSFNILIVRRTVSKSCRQIRFFQSPQLQSDAQMTPLSRGVFSNAAPQNQRTKDRLRTAIPNKKTVKWSNLGI